MQSKIMHVKDFLNWGKLKKIINDVQEERPNVSVRQVRWCSLGHNIGSEIDGKGQAFSRPVIILKKLGTDNALVLPLSHTEKTGRYLWEFEFQNEKIKARLDQVRVIDLKRIKTELGVLSKGSFAKIMNELELYYFNNKSYFEYVGGKKIFCVWNQIKMQRKNFDENVNNSNELRVEERKKIVIMCHGFRGDSTGGSRKFVRLEKKLESIGVEGFRFDQYGCGNSEGDFLESEFEDWVKTVKHIVRKFLQKNYEVSVVGESMGATAAMVAMADEEFNGKIKDLVLIVPDPVMECDPDEGEILEEKGEKYDGKYWVQAYNLNFMKCLENYKGEIFFAYGDKDEVVGIGNVDRVIELSTKRKDKILILEGEGHSGWRYSNVEKVLNEVVKRN